MSIIQSPYLQASGNLLNSNGPLDGQVWNNLWGNILQAVQYQLQLQQAGGLNGLPLTNLDGAGAYGYGSGTSIGNSYGSVPNIIGAGNNSAFAPKDFGSVGTNGGIDSQQWLMQKLFGAVPSPQTSQPSSSGELTPGVSPGESSEGSPAKKVFIVGNLRKFGGKKIPGGKGKVGTIRAGLEALLYAQDDKKKKLGERTMSKLSAEDKTKLETLLKSTDPAVTALLDQKIPNKKSLVISEDGKLLDSIDTKSLGENPDFADILKQHKKHMGDNHAVFDRSAGGKIKVGETSYDVAGTELHSPIKISLTGKDAKLDSKGDFKIDMDGFNRGKGAEKTSGGLGADEAWLVRDKDGDGIMRKGVVDGRDVYGDHSGQFKNGYDELAKEYASDLKTDPKTGKQYIDLTDPNSRAAKELKLLDANGKLRPAGEVLNRIDVDWTDVNISDQSGQNQIRQQAAVTYKNGDVKNSVDQWFATRPLRG